MTLSEKLKLKRMQLDLSLNDVAELTGTNKTTIMRWEGGRTANMGRTHIAALCKAYNMSPLEFIDTDWREEPKRPDNILTTINVHRVPMLGAVACGEPIYADGQYGDYVMSEDGVQCDFALTCQGDSMIGARIFDGDIVFVRKQDYVDDGTIAVVLLDDEATLKRVYHLSEGRIELRAENPRYRPIIVGGENETRTFKILGKAVAFQSKIV